MNAAYLYAQLEMAEEINDKRMEIYDYYREHLAPLAEQGAVELPFVPDYAKHNAHMFYMKVKDLETRSDFITYLKENGIHAVFHYIPLHTSTAGKRFGRFHGEDVYTTKESERLVRLPLFYNLEMDQVRYIVDTILKYKGF